MGRQDWQSLCDFDHIPTVVNVASKGKLVPSVMVSTRFIGVCCPLRIPGALEAKECALNNWRDIRALGQRQICAALAADPATLFLCMLF
jgi:hypothetical protein